MAEMQNYDLSNPKDKQAFQRFMIELMRNEINSYTKQTENNNPNPSADLATGLLPSGVILPFAGGPGALPTGIIQDIPSGWLLCAGAAVSRNAYSALFAIIGTTYGAGDGVTTFNLPDLNGRVPVGKGANAAVSALNNSDLLADASRNPNHTHPIPHTHNMGSHTHGEGSQFARWVAGGNIYYANVIGGGTWGTTVYGGVQTIAANAGTLSGGLSVGGSTGGPSPNTTDGVNTANSSAGVAPFLVTNYIIKT